MSWLLIAVLALLAGYITLGFYAHKTGFEKPRLQLTLRKVGPSWYHLRLVSVRWVEGEK